MQRLGPDLRTAIIAAAVFRSPAPAFAGQYWAGFKKFWSGYLGQTSGVVMTVVVVGAIALFIITRGKWGKS